MPLKLFVHLTVLEDILFMVLSVALLHREPSGMYSGPPQI